MVKNKSMCSLACPALLSTTIRCHHSGQNVVDSRRCAFCNKRSRRSLVSDLPSPPSPPSRRRTCFQRKERGLLSRTAAGNRDYLLVQNPPCWRTKECDRLLKRATPTIFISQAAPSLHSSMADFLPCDL